MEQLITSTEEEVCRECPSSGEGTFRTSPLPVFVCGSSGYIKKAFSLGCCDFICKPWDYTEMKARVLRNIQPHLLTLGTRKYRIGSTGLHLYPPVSSGGFFALPHHQLVILRILMLHRNIPVYREALQYALWGERRAHSRSVDMHVAGLRHNLTKLLSAHSPKEEEGTPIETIRNIGYKLIST